MTPIFAEGITLKKHLDNLEAMFIDLAMNRAKSNITHAAKLLGMNRTTLSMKLKALRAELDAGQLPDNHQFSDITITPRTLETIVNEINAKTDQERANGL